MATITVSDQMLARFDEEMNSAGAKDADELLQFVFDALHRGRRGVDYEDLDEETRAAIEEAEEEHRRGLGQPFAEIRAELEAEFGIAAVPK